MDLNEIATEAGMRSLTSGQRDTLINDVTEIGHIAAVIRACIAAQHIDGDKPLAAKRRAAKIDRKFQQVMRHLAKAAAKFEDINATYRREVLELPARRTKALQKKDRRRELRAATRQKAHALTAQTLTESAQHLAADPRTTGTPMPAAAQPIQYVNPYPHAYTSPNASDPLPDFTTAFEGTG